MSDSEIHPLRVLLVGYRASGKTATGLALAERLQWRAVDTDQQLVQEARMSIAQIFADRGEVEFRRLESQTLRRVVREQHVVISTGGGAVLSAANRQILKEAGPVIWLRTSASTIQARLTADRDGNRDDARPALRGQDAILEVPELLAQRVPLYQEVARLVVDTDARSVRDVADVIFHWLQTEYPRTH